MFETISNIVSPTSPAVPMYSVDECNSCLFAFVHKINDIQANVSQFISKKLPINHFSIQKPNPDPSSLPQNYRPIFKLPFIAKALENVFAKQLTTTVLDEHDISVWFPSVAFNRDSTSQSPKWSVTEE